MDLPTLGAPIIETKPDLNDVSEVISHFTFIIRVLAVHEVGGATLRALRVEALYRCFVLIVASNL